MASPNLLAQLQSTSSAENLTALRRVAAVIEARARAELSATAEDLIASAGLVGQIVPADVQALVSPNFRDTLGEAVVDLADSQNQGVWNAVASLLHTYERFRTAASAACDFGQVHGLSSADVQRLVAKLRETKLREAPETASSIASSGASVGDRYAQPEPARMPV